MVKIKKNPVFRNCSFGYLALWLIMLIAGLCERIGDLDTYNKKVIYFIVMGIVLIPIVLCCLHYSLFYIKIDDKYVIKRNLFGIKTKYEKNEVYYILIFPYKIFKNYESYERVYYKNKKIAIVTRYDINFESFSKKIKVVMKDNN